jgi:hypothetical protein
MTFIFLAKYSFRKTNTKSNVVGEGDSTSKKLEKTGRNSIPPPQNSCKSRRGSLTVEEE